MTRTLLKTIVVGLAALCITSAGTRDAAAQIPDKYTNLQVLPKDITKGDLVSLMREAAGSLGVRCSHCHVGPEDLQGMDFASDDKAPKRAARVMMKMVEEINGKYLKTLETGRAETTQVRCLTCHRGLTVPKSIHEIVAQAIAEKGVGPALSEYRELREKYYGSAAYDFSPGPLNWVVEQLAREQKYDEAFAIAAANIELNPKEAYPHFLVGRLRLARGEREAAIAAFRKGLKLDPTNDWARKQLEDLTAAEEEKE